MRRCNRYSLTVMGVVMGLLLVTGSVLADSGGGWPSAGNDLQNTRYQNTESKISAANASNLAVQWQFTTAGDVSATPAVDGSTVYFPDSAGNLYAVDRDTGALIWSRTIESYTNVPGDFSRTTPAIAGDKLIFGDQAGKKGSSANLMAVNKKTGDLLWVTQADSHPFSIITQSAIVDGNDVYVGISSAEELYSTSPGYVCCSFRGSMINVNANTGQIKWRTYTVPEGFSGGAVWGSTPAVDKSRKSLYISTGNNYSVPADVATCVAAAGNDPGALQACLPADDYFDSVMALDLKTGAVKWGTRALPYDAWNVNCFDPEFFPPELGITPNPDLCPAPAGPDYDFGQGPALFTTRMGKKNTDLVGAGQKSGQYWTFNPDTGAVVWSTQVGPGGVSGGLQWGSATDGKRIYVAESNSYNVPTDITDGGFFAALDAATGAILWRTADPTGAGDWAPVSAANGVVYGCGGDAFGQANGHMYALDAASGAILFDFASGHSCYGGAAISNGQVFWGTGYASVLGGPPVASTLTAFSTE
jgi:polyvinyl alcohol dehydrogenase (cytochrome)